MIKTVTLIALKTTLAKDNKGRKIRVKEGETFETDKNTAEMYLKTYRKVFELKDGSFVAKSNGGEKTSDNERILELENSEAKLIKENELFEKGIDQLREKLRVAELEVLRLTYEGVDLLEIGMQDLRKIAILKGLEIPKNPKKIDLVNLINGAKGEAVEEENPENGETETEAGTEAEGTEKSE